MGSQLRHGTSLKPALNMTISPNDKLVQNLKRSAKLFGWFDQKSTCMTISRNTHVTTSRNTYVTISRNTYMTISRNTYMTISSWQSEYGEQ